MSASQSSSSWVMWRCRPCGKSSPAGEWSAFYETRRGHGAASECPLCHVSSERDDIEIVMSSTEPVGARPFTGTRESLHARISDLLRRSGVEDAEQLVRALERDHATIRTALAAGLDWADMVSRNEIRRNAASRERATTDAMLIGDAIAGTTLGPPKSGETE